MPDFSLLQSLGPAWATITTATTVLPPTMWAYSKYAGYSPNVALLKHKGSYLRRALRRELSGVEVQTGVQGSPIKPHEDCDTFDKLERFHETDSISAMNSRKKLFEPMFDGELEAFAYRDFNFWRHFKRFDKLPPLRVICPAIHPSAASAFLYMKNGMGIDFETLDFSGRLGIEVLSRLDKNDFDFVVLADTPLMLWEASSIFEDLRFAGRVAQSENKIIAKRAAKESNIKFVKYQPGTTGQEHMRIKPSGDYSASKITESSIDADPIVKGLGKGTAISLVHHQADAYLASAQYREVFKPYRTQISIFASTKSEYFCNLEAYRSFLELFYFSLYRAKRYGFLAYCDLAKSDDYLEHFRSGFFSVRTLVR